MNDLKVASFTLHGTMEQSVRWKRVAEGEGFRSVGAWAARALDAYLAHRARAGRPLPLAWSMGRFRVILSDGREVEVRGMVSPPFGHFIGTAHGPDRNKNRALVLLRTGQVIATLKSAAQARALASELASALLKGELPEPGAILAHVLP